MKKSLFIGVIIFLASLIVMSIFGSYPVTLYKNIAISKGSANDWIGIFTYFVLIACSVMFYKR